MISQFSFILRSPFSSSLNLNRTSKMKILNTHHQQKMPTSESFRLDHPRQSFGPSLMMPFFSCFESKRKLMIFNFHTKKRKIFKMKNHRDSPLRFHWKFLSFLPLHNVQMQRWWRALSHRQTFSENLMGNIEIKDYSLLPFIATWARIS